MKDIISKLREIEHKLNTLMSKDIDLKGRKVVQGSPSNRKGELVTREELAQFASGTTKRVQGLAEQIERKVTPRAPNPVTGVTVSISDDGIAYIATVNWVKPPTQGGTVGYTIELRFASDENGTNITEDWGFTNQAYEYESQTYSYAPSPMSYETWVQARVAGRNAFEELSEWAYSTGWVKINASSSGDFTPATQPGLNDWSLDTPIYRADKNGNQFARVRTIVTNFPSNADMLEVWLNTGEGYKAVGLIFSATDSIHWEPQPTTAATWQVKLLAHKHSFWVKVGNDTVNPPKSLNIAPWQNALQLTSGTCSLQEMTWLNTGGKKRYRLKHTAVGPVDPNRQAIRVYRRWTDSSWNPAPGEPGNWGIISGVDATSGTSWTWYTAEIEGFPAPDTVSNYNQLAYVPINHSNDENWVGALTFNIEFSPDGGFKVSALDPNSLGYGINTDNGKLTVTSRDSGLSNGNFDAGTKDWEFSPPGSWDVVTSGAYEGNALRGQGTGVDKYAFNSNYLSVRPGQILRVTFYAATTLSGGVGFCYLQYYNPTKAGAGVSPSKVVSGSSFSLNTLVDIVPAGAAFVRVVFSVQPYATSGALLVDNVVLTVEEPVSGGLTRDSNGNVLVADSGIETAKIANLAITQQKLADAAVSTSKIQDLSIVTQKLATGAVNTTKLADLAVEAAKLANSSVTATKIANAAVGSAAIADLAVGNAHLANAAVTNAKIANAAISTANIQNLAVTENLIANGAITTPKLSTGELLVGAGGGKPVRFRVNDAFGNMIGFIGDNQDGFVGGWFQRARIGGTYTSPVIDASSTGVSVTNATITVNAVAGFNPKTISISPGTGLKVSGPYSATVKIGDPAQPYFHSILIEEVGGFDYITIGASKIIGYSGPYSDRSFNIFSSQGASQLQLTHGSTGLSMSAEPTKAYIFCNSDNSYVKFTGSGSYSDFREYRRNSQLCIDSFGHFRWPVINTENIPLGSVTATQWVPAYNLAGNYVGKIPIIP